jgi:hypothetical protein
MLSYGTGIWFLVLGDENRSRAFQKRVAWRAYGLRGVGGTAQFVRCLTLQADSTEKHYQGERMEENETGRVARMGATRNVRFEASE